MAFTIIKNPVVNKVRDCAGGGIFTISTTENTSLAPQEFKGGLWRFTTPQGVLDQYVSRGGVVVYLLDGTTGIVFDSYCCEESFAQGGTRSLIPLIANTLVDGATSWKN